MYILLHMGRGMGVGNSHLPSILHVPLYHWSEDPFKLWYPQRLFHGASCKATDSGKVMKPGEVRVCAEFDPRLGITWDTR